MPAVCLRWMLLAAVLLALNSTSAAQEPATNTARLEAHNVTVMEGAKSARIPITIDSDDPEQTVAGLMTAITVGLDSAPVPIINHDSVLAESMWAAHPAPILHVRPLSTNAVSFLQLAWTKPFGTIKARGVVAIVTVDTSRLKPGEYPVLFDQHQTSGVVTGDGSTYYNLVVQDSLVSGTLTVVAKPE